MPTNQKKVNKLNIFIAILIAFLAWIFVVYNYSPMKTVTYSNVPIVIEGEDSLAYYGYKVKKLSKDTVDVTLNINRKYYNKVSAEDIDVTVDVSSARKDSTTVGVVVNTPENSYLQRVNSSMVTVYTAPITAADVKKDSAEGSKQTSGEQE